MADTIVELLDDPQSRERMGKIGRHRIETQLSWEHSVPPLLEAYGRLAPTDRGLRSGGAGQIEDVTGSGDDAD